MSLEAPTKEKKPKKPIKCIHCGNEWPTGSIALAVTCTRCGKKTPNPHTTVPQEAKTS